MYGVVAFLRGTVMADSHAMVMMTIEDRQKAIQEKGYQWREIVYNDGSPNDCYVVFSLSNDPLLFNNPNASADLGWGRYPRRVAWRMAYDYLVLGLGKDQ